jgi:hypothetical protein
LDQSKFYPQETNQQNKLKEIECVADSFNNVDCSNYFASIGGVSRLSFPALFRNSEGGVKGGGRAGL